MNRMLEEQSSHHGPEDVQGRDPLSQDKWLQASSEAMRTWAEILRCIIERAENLPPEKQRDFLISVGADYVLEESKNEKARVRRGETPHMSSPRLRCTQSEKTDGLVN